MDLEIIFGVVAVFEERLVTLCVDARRVVSLCLSSIGFASCGVPVNKMDAGCD